MISDMDLLNISEDNLNWFRDNYEYIQNNFERKIIAVNDNKIIAYAENLKILLEMLKSMEIDSSEVLIESIPSKKEIIVLS